MANKKDNTLLWVAGLGIAGYLYWQHTQKVATSVNTTSPAVSSGAASLLPAAGTSTNSPAGNVQTGTNVMVATDMTGLRPVSVNSQTGQPVLQPGQGLAVNNNGTPILNSQGQPMTFGPAKRPAFDDFSEYATMMGETL